MRGLSLVALGLSALGLLACEARLVLGARCARTSECPDGYACVLERCREECVTFRDCPLGATCLRDEATGLRACRLEEESDCVDATGCPAGFACVGGHCAQPCELTTECGDLVCVEGEGARVCVEPTGGECDDGTDCAWGVCDAGRCDPVRGLSASNRGTCVVLESGAVECAGDNFSFQIVADDTTPLVTRFRRLVDATGAPPRFETVAVGPNHVCALADGEVRCWGDGTFGQTAGAIGRNGPFPDAILGVDGVRELAVGLDLGCGRTGGEIVCWGSDRFGLLGDAATYPSTPTTDPSRSRPARIELDEMTRDLDLGYFHACAVSFAGDLWCWGANDHGNLGLSDTGERCASAILDGTEISCATVPTRATVVGATAGFPITHVTVGLQHTCVLGTEGAVWCWGANDEGQCATGAVGPDITAPSRVLDGAIDVQAGHRHSCALLADGRIACWGHDTDGELGDGGGSPRTSPVYVSGIEDAVAMAIGDGHGCALTEAGEVHCWGRDDSGQLGDGSTEPEGARLPTFVPARVRTGG